MLRKSDTKTQHEVLTMFLDKAVKAKLPEYLGSNFGWYSPEVQERILDLFAEGVLDGLVTFSSSIGYCREKVSPEMQVKISHLVRRHFRSIIW